MILMQANLLQGSLEGMGPENQASATKIINSSGMEKNGYIGNFMYMYFNILYSIFCILYSVLWKSGKTLGVRSFYTGKYV
jgi:hypothetical protein